MTDYGDLKVSELVTLINSTYSEITEADRSNLQRALKVGEMLVDLKPRVAKHGEWQLWLKNNCPKISIETANLYMRLANNIDELEKRAAAKSVRLTDLMITQARELLAKPKPEGSDKGKANKAVKGGVEPANEPAKGREEDVAKQYLREVWEPDELVSVLKEVRGNDYLRDLSAALAKALRPVSVTTVSGVMDRLSG